MTNYDIMRQKSLDKMAEFLTYYSDELLIPEGGWKKWLESEINIENLEDSSWNLYTSYRNDEPYEYRYGESWVAMELAMEGGYKTPEEAKQAWLEYLKNKYIK